MNDNYAEAYARVHELRSAVAGLRVTADATPGNRPPLALRMALAQLRGAEAKLAALAADAQPAATGAAWAGYPVDDPPPPLTVITMAAQNWEYFCNGCLQLRFYPAAVPPSACGHCGNPNIQIGRPGTLRTLDERDDNVAQTL